MTIALLRCLIIGTSWFLVRMKTNFICYYSIIISFIITTIAIIIIGRNAKNNYASVVATIITVVAIFTAILIILFQFIA